MYIPSHGRGIKHNPRMILYYKFFAPPPQGTVYTSFDVSAFEREGNHRGSSATEAVIKDFITRGYTVDDLFLMLNAIEHVEGMRVIRNHGKPNWGGGGGGGGGLEHHR